MLAIFSTVTYRHQPFEPMGIHGVIASGLKLLTLILVSVSAWLMNRGENRPSLYTQCGMAITIVLFFAPGFGPQYLVWLVPFVAALGFRAALAYYCVGGLYLAYKYLGFPDSTAPYVWVVGFILSVSCWLMTYFLFRNYLATYGSKIVRQAYESRTA